MNKKVFKDGTVAIWREPIIEMPEVEDIKGLIRKIDEVLEEEINKKANYLLTTNIEKIEGDDAS